VTAVDAVGNESPPSDPFGVTTPPDTTPIFADDFESGDLGAWTSTSGLMVQDVVVRDGALAALGSTTTGATYAKESLPTTYPDGFLRAWVDVPSAYDQVNLLRFRTAGGTSLGYVFVTPSGALGFRNDIAATTTTSATHLDIGSGWHLVEVHLTTSGLVSTVQVWLDGAQIDDLSSTSIDMGSTPIGGIQIGEVQSGRSYVVAFDQVAFDTARLGP
jgi:hypothetical protein